MKKFAVAGIAALSLSACGGAGGVVDADADGDGEVTQEEAQAVADQIGDEVKPQPGQYKATLTFVSAELPGAPPEMVDMMGAASGNDYEFCMTEEMANQGYGEAMRENQDDSCTIDRMTIDGNDMDMAMSCNDPNMGEMTISMQGNVSPTASDLTMVTEGTFGPMGEGKMEMNIKQERIGDCEG